MAHKDHSTNNNISLDKLEENEISKNCQETNTSIQNESLNLKLIKKKKLILKTFSTCDDSASETSDINLHTFVSVVECILEDVSSGDEISTDIPQRQLQKVCALAAKLKAQGVMSRIEDDLLIKLTRTLQIYIRKTGEVTPISDSNSSENEQMLFFDAAVEKVNGALNSSLIILFILTSSKMSSRIYIEDVIEQILSFAKFQVRNTIQPIYGNINEKNSPKIKKYSSKNRQSNAKKDRSIALIGQNISEIVDLLSELLNLHKLNDSLILQVSSLGVCSFFGGLNILILSSLKLLTIAFSKYDKHRKLIIDDIFISIKLNKMDFDLYKIRIDLDISMFTALILQLIQSSAKLSKCKEYSDNTLVQKFKSLVCTASNFLNELLNKSIASKADDVNCRSILDKLVHDLLKLFSVPEWPVAEFMLTILCNLFINNITKKNLDLSLRTLSLDYLGLIAGHLKKHIILPEETLNNINGITSAIYKSDSREDFKIDSTNTPKTSNTYNLAQEILLDYFDFQSKQGKDLSFAKHLTLLIMHNEVYNEILSLKNKNKEVTKKPFSENFDLLENDKQKLNDLKVMSLSLRQKLATCGGDNQSQLLKKENIYINPDDIQQIFIFLLSKRSFYRNFTIYLSVLLKALTESSVLIRTKAIKCLTAIIEVDPSILSYKEIQLAVNHSLLDMSAQVREAAIELIGKFLLSQRDLIDKYYDVLITRILDTGINVRKRVIKILIDVCTNWPEYTKVPEILVKLVSRINDEDSIKHLLLDVFRKSWFTPVLEKPTFDSEKLVKKVVRMTDAIALSNDLSIDCFEKLLFNIVKSSDTLENTATASRQIIDCLIETVIQLEKESSEKPRLLSCIILLYLFSKVQPKLLITHANTLQPYLSIKCNNRKDLQIVNYIARTLEQVIPFIDHPSEIFMSRLEEDFIKLIMKHDQTVVKTCISCLGTVINNTTKNYKLIKHCFILYYDIIKNAKCILEMKKDATILLDIKPSLNRSMFVVGLLLQYFDFESPELVDEFTSTPLKHEAIESLMFFLPLNYDYQYYVLKALGSISIRYQDLLIMEQIKSFYNKNLIDSESPPSIKIQILNNIENFLIEEDKRWAEEDEKWKRVGKSENLKEINEINLGKASNIVQLYIHSILESLLNLNQMVRNAALKVIQLVLLQGLIHPLQMVPYLISLGTVDDKIVQNVVEKHLQEIESKYPGYTHTKAQSGMQLSYNFQKVLNQNETVRGYRLCDNQSQNPIALNHYMYMLLKTKQQRRSLIMSIIRQFDENVKVSLEYMLYLADNLAYFPYHWQDEPMFVLYQIDIILSVTGANMIQMFEENLQHKVTEVNDNSQTNMNENTLSDDDEENAESVEEILQRFPKDVTPLQQCIIASQGCLLLGLLKRHLKAVYGINDEKQTEYSPSECSKAYEKSVTRRTGIQPFSPHSVIEKLNMGLPNDKLFLISQYLELKSLINGLELNDLNLRFHKTPKSEIEATENNSSSASPSYKEGSKTLNVNKETPKTSIKEKGKRTNYRNTKLEKPKHLKKPKGKKRKLSSSEDSNA